MLNADGKVLERIEIDESHPTHVTFCGPDLSQLAITSSHGGKVYSIERTVPGFV